MAYKIRKHFQVAGYWIKKKLWKQRTANISRHKNKLTGGICLLGFQWVCYLWALSFLLSSIRLLLFLFMQWNHIEVLIFHSSTFLGQYCRCHYIILRAWAIVELYCRGTGDRYHRYGLVHAAHNQRGVTAIYHSRVFTLQFEGQKSRIMGLNRGMKACKWLWNICHCGFLIDRMNHTLATLHYRVVPLTQWTLM